MMSDDLVKRLRRKVQQFPASGGGSIGIDADGKTTSTSYITDDGYRHANPDGPEAADFIQSQEREIAELRARIAYLESGAVMMLPCPPHHWAYAPTVGYFICSRCNERINYDDPRYDEMLKALGGTNE